MKKTMLALAVLGVATAAHAENGVLPMAGKPEDVGLSSAQLKRLEEATQKHVDSGLVPGAVMLVARRGKIAWVSTLGKRDVAAGDAMKPDAIFRIYSMTKPIVSVAVMQMVEEGKLQVSDPVSKFLPEIGKMKVGTEKVVDGRAVLQLGDPERAMTVQDLLRHTSGLTYGTRGTALVNQSYVDAKIGDRGMSNEEFVAKLSTLALKFSPGTRWEYGVSTDVLCRLVEVVDGKKLGEALGARIFKPLGMVDTGFQVPADKLSRAAQARAAAQRPADDAALHRERWCEVRIGRRWADLDDGRLSALHHHAGQWRRAFRQAPARQADVGLHDGGPYRQPPRPSAGTGLRSRLRGAHHDGRGRAARFGRRVWLGRQCRYAVLDRSQGTAFCDLHGAGERSRPHRLA
jgi:CubicO group peptidase (beta-lactamase class C family)